MATMMMEMPIRVVARRYLLAFILIWGAVLLGNVYKYIGTRAQSGGDNDDHVIAIAALDDAARLAGVDSGADDDEGVLARLPGYVAYWSGTVNSLVFFLNIHHR